MAFNYEAYHNFSHQATAWNNIAAFDNYLHAASDSLDSGGGSGISDFEMQNDFEETSELNELDLNNMTLGNVVGNGSSFLRNSYSNPKQHSSQLIPSASAIPCKEPYPGKYGFEVRVDRQKQERKESKSKNWICGDENWLIVKRRVYCPFVFQTTVPPPAGTVLRVLPIYSVAEHITEPVQRCPKDIEEKDPDDTEESVQHLVMCSNKSASYEQDSNSLRFSIILPFGQTQAGTSWITHSFKFMCYGSCAGSINRRNLELVFTLEHNGEVIGRRSIIVRVCACPIRDFNNLRQPKTLKRLSLSNTKGQISSTKSDGVFTLLVRGRDAYNLLSRVNYCLEVQSNLRLQASRVAQVNNQPVGGSSRVHNQSTGGSVPLNQHLMQNNSYPAPPSVNRRHSTAILPPHNSGIVERTRHPRHPS